MTANLLNDSYFLSLVDTGYFKVSKRGEIINTKTGNIIGARQKGDDYIVVNHKDISGKMRSILAHRLVFISHFGIINNPTLQINHKDGNRRNNKISNLELTTASGNSQHAISTGLKVSRKGESLPNSKFKDKDVIKYRRLYKKGKITKSFISKKHNAALSTVAAMLRGITYKHV